MVCSDAASHEIRTQLSAPRAAIRDVPQKVRRDAVAYKLGGQVRGSLEISAEFVFTSLFCKSVEKSRRTNAIPRISGPILRVDCALGR